MYFHPETTGSAPYITDLASCYQALGNEVHVFTTWPHYPAWKAHRSGSRNEEYLGIHVHRLRTYVPAKPTLLRRLAYESIFSIQALVLGLRLRRLDVVCGCTPNLFSAVAAAILGRLRRKPIIQFVQDIVSSALVQTDQAGPGRAQYALRRLEAWACASASAVVVPTDAFGSTLVTFGVPGSKLRTIRNWSRLEVPDGAIASATEPGLILHTGNIGQKQSLDLLAPVLRSVVHAEPRLRFVFVGDGNRRQELIESIKGIPRVAVAEPVSESDYANLLRSAAVLLVHERPGVVDMSLPSKLTSYFASGRPIVAVVDPEGLTAKEVRASGGGLVVGHDDAPALLDALRRLVDDTSLAASFGRSAQEYRKQHLTADAAFAQMEAVLAEVLVGQP